MSLIPEIVETHRRREDFHRAEKAMTLRIRSVLRRYARASLSEASRQALMEPKRTKRKIEALAEITEQADLAFDELEALFAKGVEVSHPIAVASLGDYDELWQARETLRRKRLAAEKDVKLLAEQLPVWSSWAKEVRGVGALSLGMIVGEAGDIGTYSNPAKLWKRFGVGLVDHGDGLERQRKHKDAIKAHEAGYNPNRRSVLFRLGEVFIKLEGPYREVYLKRKEEEIAKAKTAGREVVPAAKVKKGRDASTYRTVGHISNRARRYAEKRFLRDLWTEWRRA